MLNANFIDDYAKRTIAEIRKFKQLHGTVPSTTQWSKEFKRCPKNLKRHGLFWEDLIETAFSKNEKKKDEKIIKKSTENIPEPTLDLDEVFDTMINVQDVNEKISPKENYAVINHKSAKEPIALIFTGDWHLGSNYVDYESWKNDLLYLLGLPSDRFKIVLTGDLIDNVFPKFKSAEPVFGTLSPNNQKKFLEELLKLMSPYMEISCWGNHDVTWDENGSGSSPVAKMLQKHSHYFFGKGYVDYMIGSEVYKIAVSHAMNGSSSFHNLQGQMKEWMTSHSEIVVGAHKHAPGVLRDTFGCHPDGTPRKRYLIQVGTYKTGNDVYSLRYFDRGAIENTTLVLHPDTHKITEFECVQDAAKWMGITSKPVEKFADLKK